MPRLREERFDRGRVQRPGEEKALALVALLALELAELVVVFDALRQQRDTGGALCLRKSGFTECGGAAGGTS